MEIMEKCVHFLSEIGIPVYFRRLEGKCFLPGLAIEKGAIVVDRDLLKYEGDILHEAGHIAVVPSEERPLLDGDTIGKRDNNQAEEMMAIAWSYAACVHLGIDPLFVFHDHGYKGGGSYIVENFAAKRYFGLPMLQWTGLAADEQRAKDLGVSTYPAMIKWLRD